MQAQLAPIDTVEIDSATFTSLSDTLPKVTLHDEPAPTVNAPRAAMEMKAIQEAIARVEAEAKAACAAENRAHAESRARALAEDRAAMDAAAAAAAQQNAQAVSYTHLTLPTSDLV